MNPITTNEDVLTSFEPISEEVIWGWYLTTTIRLCRKLQLDEGDIEDTASDILLELYSKQKKYAEVQYGNIPWLHRIVKNHLYGKKTKLDKHQYHDYRRYEKICEKYHIPFTSENAYMISRLSDNPKDTRSKICGILLAKEQDVGIVSLDACSELDIYDGLPI